MKSRSMVVCLQLAPSPDTPVLQRAIHSIEFPRMVEEAHRAGEWGICRVWIKKVLGALEDAKCLSFPCSIGKN
jgi:hypothetical protein